MIEIQKQNKPNWAKGLTKDDPRIAKRWQIRRKSDPNNDSMKRGKITRKRRDPNNESYKKIIVTRKKNHTDVNTKTWQTRKEQYGPSGHKDPEKFKETIRKTLTKESIKIRQDTRKKNDPNNEGYKKIAIIRKAHYGTDYCKDRVTAHQNWTKGQKERWNNLTEEKKMQCLKESVFKSNQHPNLSEKRVYEFITSFGFKYNGRGPIVVNGHFPDFVHESLLLIIEFDGNGGHNPELPWVPKNKLELDVARNKKYCDAGYRVLCLNEKDLQLGKEYIQNKVKCFIETKLEKEMKV